MPNNKQSFHVESLTPEDEGYNSGYYTVVATLNIGNMQGQHIMAIANTVEPKPSITPQLAGEMLHKAMGNLVKELRKKA